MIRCKYCNTDNLDTANYCIACGKCLVDEITPKQKAELQANHGEHKNSRKAKYCIYCGAKLFNDGGTDDSPKIVYPTTYKGIEDWNPYLTVTRDYPNTGCIYKGEIRDGKPQGRGFILGNDGSWWDGNFVDGKPNGFCVFYSEKSKMKDSGEYKDGVRFGKGKREFDDRIYEGEWDSKGCNGRGIGTTRTKNQDGSTSLDIQDGYFVNSKFIRGKWTYGEGNYYEGIFDENENLHGIGSHYYAKIKRLDSGEYSHGERIGKGRIEWLEKGGIYEGFWDNDGIIEGTYTDETGNVSSSYNLFSLYKYLHKCLTQEHTAEELDTVVTRIIKKTNIDNKDTILDDNNLIKACVEYLYNEAPEDEQNIFMMVELINAGVKCKGYEEYESDLDRLFSLLEEKDENHIALQYYIDFFDVGGKQGNSIFETCRKRFSCIGSPNNIFQYVKDKNDVEMLTKVIIHSYSEDSDSADTDKLKVYLVDIYEKSLISKRTVKSTDLNIDMIEVEKLKSFWMGCN